MQEQSSSDAATANLLGLGVDQTFSRSVVGGATSSLLTDALGSTIALADQTGAAQTTYTYEPFGAVTQAGAANTNPFRFTGREDDGATGLYSCQARYYAPALSRFISEDPLGYPGGPDPNLYAYVGNAPTMLVDPSAWIRAAAAGSWGSAASRTSSAPPADASSTWRRARRTSRSP